MLFFCLFFSKDLIIEYLIKKIRDNTWPDDYAEHDPEQCTVKMGVVIDVIGHSSPLIIGIQQIQNPEYKSRNTEDRNEEAYLICRIKNDAGKQSGTYSP
jgi:hypothetical protein